VFIGDFLLGVVEKGLLVGTRDEDKDHYLGVVVIFCRRDMLIFDMQIVNPKGEMKGSAITGPVGKEAAELWPVSQSA
jgi:hypothetical protein